VLEPSKNAMFPCPISGFSTLLDFTQEGLFDGSLSQFPSIALQGVLRDYEVLIVTEKFKYLT
jgi:hypothetical protein